MLNTIGLIFVACNSIAILVLSRKWAALPLIIGTCYMPLNQGITLGIFNFTIIRILLFFGVLRMLFRGEYRTAKLQTLDILLIVWAVWALISSFFHNDSVYGSPVVSRLGLIYNTLGIYFFIRCTCRSNDEIFHLILIITIALIPVALEMLWEQFSGSNVFGELADGVVEVTVRDGKLRSNGPFAHAILAGTVGAICLPLILGTRWRHRASSNLGVVACVTIVFTSNSSGPIMSLIFGILAFLLWRWRRYTRAFLYCCLALYLLLAVTMTAPPYFLLARIDLTGSSAGWHRAELIRSSMEHISEWWLIGTDYTRHWMPTGVTWSPEHTDITNHYLHYGIMGGLPLSLLFIAVLWTGFKYAAKLLNATSGDTVYFHLLIWGISSALFAHVATCISVAYFDQSFVFLYLPLAMLSSLYQYNIKADLSFTGLSALPQ